MHQQINRKIIIYLFIFFLLGTYSNKEFLDVNFLKIINFKIDGLNESETKQINQQLEVLQNENLFFLEKYKILQIIDSQKIVEKLFIFKNYPSTLNIKIKKTEFLAITKKNNLSFYLASNGNLIQAKDEIINLPFISGNIDIKGFLKLKEIIDESNFDYKNIKHLYYFKSKRWDIETKDNLIIKLPVKNLKVSFEILSRLSENSEFKDMKIIDLRQNNLVILNG
jgi:cell division protein FtsQ